MSDRHIAQLNVGRLKAPVGDPRVAAFIDALALVNGIADRSPGFVWRHQSDSGSAVDLPPTEDPLFIVNLSVWESAEALEAFVWRTVHRRFYERRAEWFEALGDLHLVFWRVAPGERPTAEEALARLEDLRANGPSERAFGWTELTGAGLWRDARCAAVA